MMSYHTVMHDLPQRYSERELESSELELKRPGLDQLLALNMSVQQVLLTTHLVSETG